MAWSARQACTKPITALSTTMTRMTIVSGQLAHQPCHHRRAQQHQHHEVLELVGQQARPAAALDAGQLVGAMLRGAALGFVGAQAVRRG